MNKLLFRILSLILFVVDILAVVAFIVLYFNSTIRISTLFKIQLILAISVVALNLIYVLYLGATLIFNRLKQKKKKQ